MEKYSRSEIIKNGKNYFCQVFISCFNPEYIVRLEKGLDTYVCYIEKSSRQEVLNEFNILNQ